MARFKSVLGFLFFLAIAAATVWWTSPALIRDFKLRDGFVPIDAQISGDCRAYLAVVESCDVDIEGPAGKTHDMLIFADFHTGDYTVNAVASATDPNVVSTSIAIEKYWNRVVTTIALIAVSLLLAFGSLLAAIRGAPLGAKPAAATPPA